MRKYSVCMFYMYHPKLKWHRLTSIKIISFVNVQGSIKCFGVRTSLSWTNSDFIIWTNYFNKYHSNMFGIEITSLFLKLKLRFTMTGLIVTIIFWNPLNSIRSLVTLLLQRFSVISIQIYNKQMIMNQICNW